MSSYLIYMAVRLIELRRVLKPTGSIYLHCDPTAGAYLKVTMDAVFGKANFRNEITWRRTSGRSDARRFARVSDRILYYADDSAAWNGAWQSLDPEYVDRFYRHEDTRGRYRVGDLTGPAHGADGSAPSAQPWRSVDPLAAGRVWSVPRTGGYAEWIEREVIPGYRNIESIAGRLDALDVAGLIAWPKRGRMPQIKRYLAASRGVAASDIVTDIAIAGGKERVGYPTQKPLALLERIIAASSNEGDMVLDPFCGCATACVAAEKLGREWAGIDISPKAAELVRSRMRGELGLFYRGVHRTDIPERTDQGAVPPYDADTNKRRLYGKQEGRCGGCEVLFPYRNLTVDHVVPRSKGGGDAIANLQLLCGACNSTKGAGTHEELIAKLAKSGIR